MVQIVEDTVHRLTFPYFLGQLQQVIGTLLEHHGVVSLEGDTGRESINDHWDARPLSEASTTDGLSADVETIVATLGKDCLESRSEMVHDVQELELIFLEAF